MSNMTVRRPCGDLERSDVAETHLARAATPQAAPAHWAALSVVLVGAFMAILDTFIVLVAAPAIQADLHASSGQIQFILAGYQLTYAVGLITGARLGDLVGRRRMFMAGMALFTLSSVGCALAPTAGSLIAARLVQGLAAAAMFPQVFSFIQVLLPPDRRHHAFGALGAVIGVSTTIGQLVGGLLISADLFGTSWRPVFWVNVPIGIVALVLAARLVPESRAPQARRLDLAGVGALSVALFLLVVPLIAGRQAGWPLWSWLCLAASVLAFVAFGLVERGVAAAGRTPLVALGLLRERPFAVGGALVVIAYAGVNSFFLVLSLVFQDGLGLDALGAGLAYTPLAAAFFLASILASRLAPRLGRRLLLGGTAIAGVGFVATMVVAALAGDRISVGLLMPALILVGFGNGVLLTPLLNTVLSRIGPNEVGMASGVLSTGQQVGGALGVAVIGVLFFQALGSGGGTAGYGHALAVAVLLNIAIALAVTVLLFVLPRPAR
jgi:EmrB/QacA subfamily drug resistance transporter